MGEDFELEKMGQLGSCMHSLSSAWAAGYQVQVSRAVDVAVLDSSHARVLGLLQPMDMRQDRLPRLSGANLRAAAAAAKASACAAKTSVASRSTAATACASSSTATGTRLLR